MGENRAQKIACPQIGCNQTTDADLPRRLPLQEATWRLLNQVRCSPRRLMSVMRRPNFA